jgi:hypothetical protein
MSGIGCHNNRQMNHVIVAAATSASSGTYTYDGNNLRVKKVSGSTTTVYIFAGSKVIAEYQNGAAVNAPTREYIYSGATLLAKIEAGATNYYHPDHLSPRVTTDVAMGLAFEEVSLKSQALLREWLLKASGGRSGFKESGRTLRVGQFVDADLTFAGIRSIS